VDIMSTQFLSALFAIVIIDLVLAGDNAIVIALAARNVPKHLQRRAIMWGTVGAIVVRTTLTLVVVALLKVPGLLFAGGLFLIWIAYKLLIPEEGGGGHDAASAATSFWGALRTIVIADTVMGLDNVLAVAGAAHGSFLLVAIGLLISIPIVIWGSTLLLRFVERYPAIVYVGSGVLAWTSVKMMSSEPLVAEYIAGHSLVVAAAYIAVIGGVLGAGFVHNHRTLESRISARIAGFPRDEAAASAQSIRTEKEEVPMLKILVPVDGSRNSAHAVRHVIGEYRRHPGFEVHLLNVQPPFSRHVSQFVARRDRDAHRKAQAEAVLTPLRDMLEAASVPFAQHIRIGRRAETIADEAKRLKCDHIVLATARKNSLTRMIESSVTNRLLDLTSVPVEVVVGDSVSKLERYGIPLGLGAGLGTLMVLAFD
jgi:YjbE family integral membrane protein